jgi:hypothetical protein
VNQGLSKAAVQFEHEQDLQFRNTSGYIG